jgi:Terpene cyclase DEP1
MLSLLVHALLGVVTVVAIVRANPTIFRRPASGPMFSGLELAFYACCVVSVAVGWTFNIRFVVENTDGWLTNPLWGDGSWAQYMQLMFDNPAAGSASGDFITANVVVLPLALYAGRGRGINGLWLYFVATLFTSFSLGWALYLATLERQRRIGQDPVAADSSAASGGGTQSSSTAASTSSSA